MGKSGSKLFFFYIDMLRTGAPFEFSKRELSRFIYCLGQDFSAPVRHIYGILRRKYWEPKFKKFESFINEKTKGIYPCNMSWDSFIYQSNIFERCSEIYFMYNGKEQFMQGDIEFQFHLGKNFKKDYIQIVTDDDYSPYKDRKVYLKDITWLEWK
jgi:hypothetical protein